MIFNSQVSKNANNHVKAIAEVVAGLTEDQLMAHLFGAGYTPERVWKPTDMILVYVGGFTIAIVDADVARPGVDDIVVDGFKACRQHKRIVGLID